MQFQQAKVVDILRSHQRDEAFTAEAQNDFAELLKSFGSGSYSLIKHVPLMAKLWYYTMTSASNLQTLGEEYAGILRYDGQKIPSTTLQLLWLLLSVYGESIYDKLLDELKLTIKRSPSIVDDAKTVLIKYIDFFKEKKYIIRRLHQSLFYINGTYYGISNRLTGIKYVLLRDWMQDDSSTRSFKFLGHVTLLYVIFHLAQEFIKYNQAKHESVISHSKSTKGCVLCGENRRNTSATMCGHLFCWECIYDSLKYQPNCPICREVVDPSRITLLQNFL